MHFYTWHDQAPPPSSSSTGGMTSLHQSPSNSSNNKSPPMISTGSGYHHQHPTQHPLTLHPSNNHQGLGVSPISSPLPVQLETPQYHHHSEDTHHQQHHGGYSSDYIVGSGSSYQQAGSPGSVSSIHSLENRDSSGMNNPSGYGSPLPLNQKEGSMDNSSDHVVRWSPLTPPHQPHFGLKIEGN